MTDQAEDLTLAQLNGVRAELGAAQRELTAMRRHGTRMIDVLNELYQVLGALDAPDKVLDQTVAAMDDKSLPYETLLPFIVEVPADASAHVNTSESPVTSMQERYPAYYKDVRELDVVDVYQVHSLFVINDPSGCLHHSSKKILLAGSRTGGKPVRKDIEEARDTLNRWLQINDVES